MTTAIDTNIFVSFWDSNDASNSAVTSALEAAARLGPLVVAAPVYSELLAFPSRTAEFLDYFFADTGIVVEWNLDESIWRLAGLAFQAHASRRKAQRGSGPRKILADFLIGAHALRRGCTLLTMDERIYRTSFPRLRIAKI
jgi:predicted nucleic acid-binding protein